MKKECIWYKWWKGVVSAGAVHEVAYLKLAPLDAL